MVGDGEVAELIGGVQVAAVHGQHHVVEALVGILGHVGPYVGVEPFVAVAVEHEFGVGVGNLVFGVDDVVVGIPFVVLEARDGGPEVALAVIVLILHDVLVEDVVVVPRGHEYHRAHLGRAAGIGACGGGAGIGHVDAFSVGLASVDGRCRYLV